MKRLVIITAAAVALSGCASAAPAFNAFADFLIETDPNRHVSTVTVGRERYTVTTRVSRDGRRSTVTVR